MTTSNDTFDPYAQWLGLNLRAEPLDHYLLLGLQRFEAEPAVIERHADERMRLVRSFQTGPRGRYTQKLMNELSAAKLCLLSPAAKQAYDQQLALWMQAGGPRVSLAPPQADLASPADLPAADLPDGAGRFAAPPPVGHVGGAPPLPPAALPVATRADGSEDGGARAAELARAPANVTLIAGLVVGVLCLALTGWVGLVLSRSSDPAKVQLNSSEAAANQGAPVEGLPPEGSAASASHPGTGRLPLPGDDEAIEVLQEGGGDVLLSPATASLAGGLELTLEGTEDVIAGWSSPEDVARWRFRLIEPGFFQLQITYAAGGGSFGRKVELLIDEQAKSFELQPTSVGYRTDLLTIAVPKSGSHTLELRQGNEFAGELRLKLVRLQAVAK